MRRALVLSSLLFCFSAVAEAQSPHRAISEAPAKPAAATLPASPIAAQAARASFAQLPLSFEENRGQSDGRVKFMSRAANYNLFLTSQQAVLTLHRGNANSGSKDAVESAVLWLKMLGSNADAQISGTDLLPGKINYYFGNDPSKWRVGVRQYGRVSYQGIYPGVDLTYYGNQRQLESDFVVAPGGDPRAIEFEVKGSQQSNLDGQGNLVLTTSAGQVQLLRPSIYQMVKGARKEVSGRYVFRGKDRIGFEIAKYDTHNTLIIDPVLVYSTFLGGSNTSSGDGAFAIAIDAQGHAYVTGQGTSSDFPGADPSGPPIQSLSDFAFVTELTSNGSSGAALVYSTILSGSTGYSTTVSNGIGVDSSGKAYIAGNTGATDFPLLNPFQATPGNGTADYEPTGFVAGLATDGTLIYSTYFGGRNDNDTTSLNGVFADASGNAYVVGSTTSQNFPTVNPYQATSNTQSYSSTAIVAKFNPQGQPIYSTYLGGNSSEVGNAIVADGAGNAYVTGQTSSSNFPVQTSPAPFQATLHGGYNLFISKLSFNTVSSTLTLASSTFFGGTSNDQGWGITIDTQSPPNVYVTGTTTSSGTGTNAFPTSSTAFSKTNGGSGDAFVAKLSNNLATLSYSTFLGGTAADTGYAIAVDGASPAHAFVTGSTSSLNFPLLTPLQSALGGATATNAFLTELQTDGSALIYSTYFGGISGDQGRGIAVDSLDNAYIAGRTASPNFPVLSGGSAGTAPFQGQLGTTAGNAFVAKISPSVPPSALNFFPPTYNFHNVGVGAFTSETFTLTNNTGASVTNISFLFTGVSAGEYSTQLAGSSCSISTPFTLAAGASCTVNVRFAPTAQDVRAAQLTIPSSSPASSTVLSLTGLGGAPELSLSTTSITFFPNPDPLNVQTTSSVTITNTGGAPLQVGSAQISASTPTNAAPFSIPTSGSSCTTAIAPGSSCFLEVAFTPTAVGTFNATLLINSNAAGSPAIVTLTGAGVQEVVVQPTSLELGPNVVNNTAIVNENEAELVNGSGGTITVTVTPGTGGTQADFHLNNINGANTCTTGLHLAPGGTCFLFVYFQPTPTGPTGTTDGRMGSYTVAWSGALTGSQAVNVMGTALLGVSLYTNNIVAPNEYVGIDESSAGLEAVFNGTNSAITVTIGIGGNNPTDFTATLDSSCAPGGVIPANTYCGVDLSFKPSALGLRSAVISFHYTGDNGDPLVLNGSGTGIPGPVQFPSVSDFGSEIISTTTPERKFLFRNVSTVPLNLQSITGPGNADFKITSDSTCAVATIPGGGSCFIGMTFTPSTLTKETDTIVVTDAFANSGGADPGSPHTLHLSGTGEPAVITVSVSTGGQNILDFGNVALTPSPIPQAEIFLTNASNTPTTITWSGGSPVLNTAITAFSLVASGTNVTTCTQSKVVLPQGGTCLIGVQFNPAAIGLQTNSVTFTDSVSGTAHTVNIQGTGAPQGKVSLSTTSLSFTQVANTTSSPQSITLTNTGSGPLTITSTSLSGSNAADYTIASGTTCTVGTVIPVGPTGNTCVLNVTFTAPATAGSYFEGVSLQANLGNNATSSNFLSLSGTVVSGGFTLSPAGPINFGPVGVGSSVTSAEYTLTNQNTTTVTFQTMTVPTGYSIAFDDCSNTAIASNSECFFEITFSPTSAGSKNGTLTLPYTGATGSPFTVALQGSGVAALAANPNPVTFSFATVGQSAFSSVSITNGNASAVSITSLGAFTGPNAADFTIPQFDDGCTGQTLAASGGSCSIFFNFLSNTAGTFTAQFLVNSKVGSVPQTPLTVNMSATIPVALAILSPNPLIFPSQAVNSQSQPLNVTVTNSISATAALNVSNMQISGSNDFAFAVSNSGNGCYSLLAGQSCTIPITFTPSQANARAATLTITDNGSPVTQTLSLQGTGVAGNVFTETTNLGFPQTNVGSSVTLGLVLTNASASPIAFSSVTYTGPYSTDVGPNSCVGKTVGSATGTCILYIKFSPTGGTATGTAVIKYNGSTTLPTVNLTGTQSNPVVSVNPTSLTFTSGQLVNTQSSPLPVVLTNGTSSAVTISGTPSISGDFLLGTNSCTNGASVGGSGGTCTVNVIFKPGGTGSRLGTLVISDSPDTLSPHIVNLSGTGVAADVTITKSHSGSFIVGQTGDYQITVTNVGGGSTSGNTTVTDTLPAGMTFNSNSNTGVWSCNAVSQTVTCQTSAGIAGNGGSSAFDLVVNVGAAAAGTPTNSASVTTVADTGTTGKTASDPTTVTFPAPTVTTLSPTSAIAGGAALTLTVNGTNFDSSTVVNFNGAARTTALVSGTQVTIQLTAGDIGTAGTFNVSVTNPAPGGGTSGNLTFTVNNPSPTATSLSPSSAIVGGAAFTLTVNGTNFVTGSVASFNGTARTTTFVSATQVTIPVAAGDIAATGTFNVSVTNPAPAGGTSGNLPFAVNNPVPAVTSLSPNNTLVGGSPFTLTVNGTNFVSGAVVNFNGVAKTTTFVSKTQVTAAITAPDIATAGAFNVTVANPTPGGGASTASTFTVNNPVPSITSLSPNGVTVSTGAFTLTVNGTNFVSGSVVNYNGSARATTFVNSTKLTAAVLAGDITTVGPANVTVTNPAPGGGTTSNFVFTVASAPNPVPTLTSVSPTTGVVGQAVNLTLTGTNFIAGSIVNFGASGDTGGIPSNGGATLTITIPANQLTAAGPISVTVTNPAPGGGTTSAQTFNINNPVPAVSSLSPNSAIVGESAFTLTVNGSNFVSTSAVTFKGTARTTTFVSSTQLTIQVTAPDLAATGAFNLSVANPTPGGGTSGNATFAVNNPLPVISSISPTSASAGGAGFTLTVNGSGFVSGAIVNFNGAAKSTTFVNATQVTAAITAGDIATAGTPNVTITNPTPGGGTSTATTFTVNNPVPSITSLSPGSASAGGLGLTLTVNGTGFVPTSVVNFNGIAKTTTFVSVTKVTATLGPADIALAGAANVWVTNPGPGGGTTSNWPFPIIVGTGVGYRFVPVAACRIADTRNATGAFGGPSIAGQTARSFVVTSSSCGIPSTAAAYSLNVTVLPHVTLGFITVWPTGQSQPPVSTLNSPDGRSKANAAIVPAGTGGAVSIFATDTTDVLLDINGYFVPTVTPAALSFYPITPCRLVDTRSPAGSLGGPSLVAAQSRTFPVMSGSCNLPSTAQVYSLNLTAVPKGPLASLTAWPTGQTQPAVATLVAPTGTLSAIAALVPAGTTGSINVSATDITDLLIDINGYFAPPGPGGLSFYTVSPCRILDTRSAAGAFDGELDVNVIGSSCGIPSTAQAYIFNSTVLPTKTLGYLTLWPQGATQPLVSTLNAQDGAITSNMAILPTTNGLVSAFSSDSTQMLLDISGYFAFGNESNAALISSTNPSTSGQSVTFTATVASPATGTPTGSVTFLNNGTSIGTGTLNGSGIATLTTSSLAVGTHTITAQYPGDGNFAASTSNAVMQVVLTAAPTGYRFVPVTPCRIADTRNPAGPFGAPSIASQSSRSFVIPSSACGIPSTAAAYSLNVTVVPAKTLGYITMWPTGQPQPLVSTLNSLDGRVKANAAIVPAGTGGAVSIFAVDQTDVILDINGYFVAPTVTPSALAFYPLTPCRLVDTRSPVGPLAGPSLVGGQSRTFPVQSSSCNVPSNAQAYSLNFTAVPPKALGYLTVWPTGQAQPLVSTLNVPTGTPTANAAIVPSGTSGSIDTFVKDDSDMIIDINGYFAPPGPGGLSLYTTTPCRVLDTRTVGTGAAFSGQLDVNVAGSGCGLPAAAEAYVFNATVVPQPNGLGFLTMWPAGQTQPLVSTLNANDGAVTSNMAIVPTSNGAVSEFAKDPTQLILDIAAYFAP